MNYFLATASYEHFVLQYLEYGFSMFKSLPHQVQQRYKGLTFMTFIKNLTLRQRSDKYES